jgi:DUF971 family protein
VVQSRRYLEALFKDSFFTLDFNLLRELHPSSHVTGLFQHLVTLQVDQQVQTGVTGGEEKEDGRIECTEGKGC